MCSKIEVALSVVIPTVGRETLRQVLRALDEQAKASGQMVEVIVGWDGAGEWEGGKYEHLAVVWVRTPAPRSGAATARNAGLARAKGEIVALLGDDTVPEAGWLAGVLGWHAQHPTRTDALLGPVRWPSDWADDAFHQWLVRGSWWGAGPQFDGGKLESGEGLTWRHFYTSNVSLKREFLEEKRFDTGFVGWGFEDTELGYRLTQEGMTLHAAPSLGVRHHHWQTLAQVLRQTRQARRNALYFRQLHPEVALHPRGTWRGVVLGVWLRLSWPLTLVSQKYGWWHAWKSVWLWG